MLQQMYIVIAVISYIILLRDIFSKRRVQQFSLILCGIFVLFGLTMFFYSSTPKSFTTAILHFGSVCISASVCGMHLAITRPWREIDNLLPYFVAFIGLAVGIFGMRTLLLNFLTDNEGSSLDYQNVSYFMAEIFAFSGYYAFLSTAQKSALHRVIKWLAYLFMVFSASVVVFSGGRGGFLLMCVYVIVFVYLLVASNRLSKSNATVIIVLAIVAFFFLAAKYSIFESVGFERISTTLTEDSNRKELYSRAWKVFESSPLFGHGLGAVWMEVGFYCHNIFLDLLVEIGIIGLLAFMYLYLLSASKLWRWRNNAPIFIFMLIPMLKVMVMTLFSGYWLNSLQLWLIFGFVFIASSKNYHLSGIVIKK